MAINLAKNASVLINYHRPVPLSLNPMPRDEFKDTLQVKCSVDGSTFRSSSSYVISYLTEYRAVTKVSGTFLASLMPHPIPFFCNGRNWEQM